MASLVRVAKPVAVEKCGRPIVAVRGMVWQTYIPEDASDDRTYEHNETRDEWYEVRGI